MFKSDPYQMVSGQAVAVERKYHKVQDAYNRTWLYSDCDNAGDYVYVSNAFNKKGEGFGGATLHMPLEDGGVFDLNGGWHSNAEALFEATGVDVRNKYLTFVVIGLDREFIGDYGQLQMNEVVYQDDKPQVGPYSRGELLAQKYANELGRSVFLYMKFEGGSMSREVKPVEKNA